MLDMDYELTIGAIDDGDITYVNGQRVGATLGDRDQRVYKVPKEILHEGLNVIAIMHCDYWGKSSVDGPIYLRKLQREIRFFWKGVGQVFFTQTSLIQN